MHEIITKSTIPCVVNLPRTHVNETLVLRAVVAAARERGDVNNMEREKQPGKAR